MVTLREGLEMFQTGTEQLGKGMTTYGTMKGRKRTIEQLRETPEEEFKGGRVGRVGAAAAAYEGESVAPFLREPEALTPSKIRAMAFKRYYEDKDPSMMYALVRFENAFKDTFGSDKSTELPEYKNVPIPLDKMDFAQLNGIVEGLNYTPGTDPTAFMRRFNTETINASKDVMGAEIQYTKDSQQYKEAKANYDKFHHARYKMLEDAINKEVPATKITFKRDPITRSNTLQTLNQRFGMAVVGGLQTGVGEAKKWKTVDVPVEFETSKKKGYVIRGGRKERMFETEEGETLTLSEF